MDEAGSRLLFFLAAETTETAADPNFWFSTSLKLLAVFLLVAANGFFVATEFSLVTVRKARI